MSLEGVLGKQEVTHVFSLKFARHGFRLLDDIVHVRNHALAEDLIDIERLAPHSHPGAHFISTEQAEVILEVELRGKELEQMQGRCWQSTYFWLCQCLSDGHNTSRKDSICEHGSNDASQDPGASLSWQSGR
jgi:hypothetical protein